MDVIVNTDHSITLSERSAEELQSEVESALRNFAPRLTRVEVHLSDQSAGRSTGNDIRCLLEARPEGRHPESATADASTVDDAVHGALRKMLRVLDAESGRLDRRKGASSMGGIEPR